MAANRQQQGNIRTTALIPEAVIPQTSTRQIPWGPLLVGLLVVVTAGIALAWALGFAGLREAEPIVRVTSAVTSAPTPRSPYPSDLTDLFDHQARPVTPPSPAPAAEPAPVPTPEPVAVEPPPPVPSPMPVPHVERVKMVPLLPITVAVRVPTVLRPLPRPAASPPRPIAQKIAPARAAQPLGGQLAGVFVPSDYPAAARRNGERGDVTVRLEVGSDGRANGCRILAADASATLKAATCAILIQRARFVPAADPSGAATAGFFVQHVAWRLP